MGKYVYAYLGGGMATTDEERDAAMAAWGAWFGQLGAAVVDGGNPFAASAAIASDGSRSGSGKAALTGYSIVEADSLDAAGDLAKGCPILTSGGSLDVYEVLPVM